MKITLPPSSIKKVVFLTVFSTFLGTAAYFAPLYAQQQTEIIEVVPDESSLTAIPTRLGDDGSLKIKPGEKKQIEVRVINSGAQQQNIITEKIDFTVGEDGATPVAITETAEGSNRWSLASWLVLTPPEQTLGTTSATRTGIINVLIEAPTDALPGGHYAMITHRPTLGALETDGSSAASGINQRVGTLLYVMVEGPVNEDAYITNFTIPTFNEFGPVPYSFIVDNRSDVHITPKIGVTIKNMFGKTVEVIQPDTKNIFPFTSRSFEGEWSRIWGFGRYTADVVITFGDQGKVAMATTSFWLIPIKLVITIGIILLTLIAVFISIRRHMIHRKQDQSSRINELEQKIQSLQKEKLEKFEE